jgi:tyrosyl-tRNA synthetase
MLLARNASSLRCAVRTLSAAVKPFGKGRVFLSGDAAQLTEKVEGLATASSVPYSSAFMRAMSERGYLHQCTDAAGLDKAMAEGGAEGISAYLGFDATAKSLHVGSLVQLMILRLLQKTGHRPIVLMGGGTSKVGDPSGKDKGRQLLSTSEIETNIGHISKVFRKFMTFKESDTACPNPALLVNNANWLNSLKYIDFLRDYGKHFSVNRMLSFDSVKTRLAREEPLSFIEFNYMILQAYDFKYIHEKYGAILQIGGSDQWGNMVCGIELVRKTEHKSVHGLTAPLITTSDGSKMGKSESGAVWLDKDLLSEFDYWQFWRNISDADVNRFLKLFTELPLEEIEELTARGGSSLNVAKVVLANEATRLLHGDDCLKKIHRAVEEMYSGGRPASGMQVYGGADADGDSDDEDPMDALPLVEFTDPKVLVSDADAAVTGVDIGTALMLCRLSASRAEGRRLVKGGGVRVNGVKVEDQYMVLDKSHFISKERLQLSVGKKRHIAFSVPEAVWVARAERDKAAPAKETVVEIKSEIKPKKVKTEKKAKAVKKPEGEADELKPKKEKKVKEPKEKTVKEPKVPKEKKITKKQAKKDAEDLANSEQEKEEAK